jgi:uncharacterized membrane protein HdeD (DUF308 family)
MLTATAAQNWGMFVVRGILAIAFGVLAFAAPGPTLTALVFVFAIYAVLDGLFAVIAGLALPLPSRWLLVVGGAIGVVIGVYAFLNPQTTAVALVYLIGAYAIIRGVAEVGASLSLRSVMDSPWLLALSGVINVIFGGLLIAAPGDGAVAVLWIIGFYALLAGAAYVAAGFRLRSLNKEIGAATSNQTTHQAPSAS